MTKNLHGILKLILSALNKSVVPFSDDPPRPIRPLNTRPPI